MPGKRLPLQPPQLLPLHETQKGEPVRILTREAVDALQRFLRDLYNMQEGGTPGGFYEGAPTQILAGEDASAGYPIGWSGGLHRHAIKTSPAVALTTLSTNTEGVSNALARSDHTHDLSAIATAIDDAASAGGEASARRWAFMFGGFE